MDISDFYQTFFEEAVELLTDMERLLLELDPGNPSDEDLNAIFRAAHSIKGGAATFGFTPLTETTHLAENLLDRARHHEITITQKMIEVLLRTKDALQEQIDSYAASQEPDAASVAEICGVLRQLAQDYLSDPSGGVSSAQSNASTPMADTVVPLAEEAGSADFDAALYVMLSDIGEGDATLLRDELGNLGTIKGEQAGPRWLKIWLDTTCSTDDIVAVCCFVIDAAQVSIGSGRARTLAVAEVSAPALPATGEVTPTATAAAVPDSRAKQIKAEKAEKSDARGPAKENGTIRVDVDKVDQIINLVGELVITQAMLAQNAAALDPVAHERLLNGMSLLERNARDLQESVMSIRMMQMEYVFSRFPRVVRDLSAKLGKQVRLDTEGAATELDKSLIERIVDPLTHLVRNSLDHGIEQPEVRQAAGKDPVGRLLLSAQHQGGNIVIEVSDDGAGLNRERILAKARSQNLPLSDNMSDEAVWQLIFAPGFSTAEQITDVSGRGVGMDVVKRNIQQMGGHVEILSRGGRGTTIRIILPLTLAILDGMSVKVGEEVYILPLNYVIESLQPSAADIRSIAADDHVLHVRGEYLPLKALHSAFGIEGARQDPTRSIAVILKGEGKRYALLVDQLVGQHQVVVKNLETNYRKVPGISAATILGDGSVALIIDVAAIQKGNSGRFSLQIAA